MNQLDETLKNAINELSRETLQKYGLWKEPENEKKRE